MGCLRILQVTLTPNYVAPSAINKYNYWTLASVFGRFYFGALQVILLFLGTIIAIFSNFNFDMGKVMLFHMNLYLISSHKQVKVVNQTFAYKPIYV